MSQVGDALVDVLLESPREPKADRLGQFFNWLKRVSKPPLGVRLISDDGGQFTGIVLVSENTPVAMLALRIAAASSRAADDGRQCERRFTAGPLWREGDDIYRR